MDVIKIQIDTNAQEAGKTFDDLGKSFKNTDAQAEDLRKQIRGLKDELYKLTPGTEEYGRVLQELGGKMDQLSDTSQELRVATGGLDAVFQSTTNATATMAAGFTAATGVVALFGGDTEDLAKTFVKLQAVMSIMNGLKGFAGFGKITKQASTSLKAYIAQMRLARTATLQESAANTTLTVTTNTASVATKGLGTAIKSVTAAIAANPIGALLVALTAAITAITSFNNKAKEAEEQVKRWNDVLHDLQGSQYTYSSILEQDQAYFNKEIAAMEALGASQESINQKTLEYSKKRREQLAADRDYYEHLIEANKANKDLNEQMEKWAEKARECNAEIKELDSTIAKLSYKLPAFASEFDEAFSGLERDLSRKVARGVMSERQAVTEEIDFYNKEIKRLQETVRDYEIALGKRSVGIDENGRQIYNPNTSLSAQEKKQMEQDIIGMNSRIEKYSREVKNYTKTLEDINDRRVKSQSEAYKKLVEEQKKNYETFSKEFDKEYDNMYKEVINFDKKMEELFEGMGFGDEESRGKARNSLTLIIKDLDTFTNTWRKKADELALANKISSGSWNSFITDLETKMDNLKDISMHFTDDIDLTDYAVAINNRLLRSVKYLKDGLNTIDQLQKEGLINTEQYQNAYIEHIEGFKSRMADDAEDIEDYLARILSGDVDADTYNGDGTLAEFLEKQKMTVEQYVTMLRSLFEQSGTLLPSEFAKSVTDGISNIIDSQFKEIETKTKNGLRDLANSMALDSTAWIQGRSDTGIIATLIFGGKSPTQAYEEAQKYAQDVYKALYDEYTAEIKLIEDKMSLLDKNSDAYRKYADQINEIQRKLTEAQIDYEQKQVDNAEDYADKIKDIGMSTFDALGGLASAMGSYYGEQKEQAKELYGENSEEYQKYLKKEGTMKIAEVWANWATGVMAAWAANAKYGVASYILAALQTAALTATAIASTQQINRSTKANSSGGGSTANVSGLTDRVIMGQVQDTDQTAQLNAGYNQGAQRVFVTVDDINNGQDANRTAVSNNRF